MRLSRHAAAILAAVLLAAAPVGAPVAEARTKTLRDVTGPAEIPPAGYSGRQYVDSTGCVFLRAGVDGNVTWIPRVDRNRKLLCGQPPTPGAASGAAPGTAAMAAAPAPAPGALAVTAVVEAPQPAAAAAPAVAAPAVAAPAEPLKTVVAAAPPALKGYKPAWKDGRLNPGRGTGKARAAQASAPAASSRALAAPPGGRYVQVGIFADPANAGRTIARLQAMGLPVSRSAVVSGGRSAQSVVAGPLAAPDLPAALGAVRRAGFPDAYIR